MVVLGEGGGSYERGNPVRAPLASTADLDITFDEGVPFHQDQLTYPVQTVPGRWLTRQGQHCSSVRSVYCLVTGGREHGEELCGWGSKCAFRV